MNDILTVNNLNFLTFIRRNLHWIRRTSCPSLAALTRASTTKGAIFLSLSSFFHFWTVTFLWSHHMELTFLSWLFLHVSDFNELNLVIVEKVLHQWYRFHKLLNTFTKLYYRNRNLVYEYNSKCRNLIKKGVSHLCFYVDVFNKDKKLKSDTSL